MTTIYIVTSGCYSDYGINGVFSTEKNAENFILAFNIDDSRIEEYELDEFIDVIEQHKGMKYYEVVMYKNGVTASCRTCRYNKENQATEIYDTYYADKRSVMIAYAWAKDEQHAVKIANERRVALILQDKFPDATPTER